MKGFDDCDWLAVLVPKQQQAATESRAARLAPVSDQPGSSSADYLRREQPNASVCYERFPAGQAPAIAWAVPSLSSLMRRLELEVPKPQQVMCCARASTR